MLKRREIKRGDGGSGKEGIGRGNGKKEMERRELDVDNGVEGLGRRE